MWTNDLQNNSKSVARTRVILPVILWQNSYLDVAIVNGVSTLRQRFKRITTTLNMELCFEWNKICRFAFVLVVEHLHNFVEIRDLLA